jgi:hypothetical protein
MKRAAGDVGCGDDRSDSARAFCSGQIDREIARDLRLSRNTVRKVLRSDETSFSYARQVQPRPKLGRWKGELDRLLAANAEAPGRERLTLIRIFEELRALGDEGGYDAVRRYASAWAKSNASTTASAFVPLTFAPGEAYQFDWSHEIVVLDGVTTIDPSCCLTTAPAISREISPTGSPTARSNTYAARPTIQ